MTALEIPNFHRLRRSKLRALLSRGLNIQYNKQLKDILFKLDGESIMTVFEDGAHVTGRLLVGTNGSRSSVREILLAQRRHS
jgi:2-polyprenyl-6-methoxyphenol hydroxylase-like FAD-dependent oxidoreductase